MRTAESFIRTAREKSSCLAERREKRGDARPAATGGTHPVPLHAHTHFLAPVRAALVLDHVHVEALAASALLRALRVIQHFSHSLLVSCIETLRVGGEGPPVSTAPWEERPRQRKDTGETEQLLNTGWSVRAVILGDVHVRLVPFTVCQLYFRLKTLRAKTESQ